MYRRIGKMYIDDPRFAAYYTGIGHILPYSCAMRLRTSAIYKKASITENEDIMAIKKLFKSDEEWKKILTPEQYHILREAGTETAGSCAFLIKRKGLFHSSACDNPLFISKANIESEKKWPSFFEPYSPESIILKEDNRLGMKRTEVICARCDGHLGHVFDDGPPPTYKRYCINGTVLKFVSGENRK